MFAFVESVTNSQSKVVSYQCRLDGGSYKTCLSPKNLNRLSDGYHSFSVIGFDQAGNKSSPITYKWHVDSSSPTIAFSRKPESISSSGQAFFSFQSHDKGSGVEGFQCRLDKESYKSCNDFLTLTKLSPGTHVFSVKAVDRAGNFSKVFNTNGLLINQNP